jgi:hypothetical protein
LYSGFIRLIFVKGFPIIQFGDLSLTIIINARINVMRRSKVKAKLKEENLPDDQIVMDDTPIPETPVVDSIQDFIELKRLQNRILGKIIDQISHPENSEKTNNK